MVDNEKFKIILRENLNKIKHTMCMQIIKGVYIRNFHGMLKGKHQLAKRQYVHATTNTTATTTPSTTSIVPTTKAKSIKMNISGSADGEAQLN